MTSTSLSKHLFLIGYRGTGKTTVASILAALLQTRWIDLDVVIENKAGKTISELFAEGGEPLFRDWETRCLQELIDADGPPQVISLGGGAILRQENRDFIATHGDCVWLTATPDTIAQRIGADQTTAARRPALTDLSPTEEIKSVLTSREPIYRETSQYSVSTDTLTPVEVADRIAQWLVS
ncbi:shikimate kinase [Stieleria sp. JC731]|uniref:shikimate kinase n=1 Tax=Pirellulaceae TaxID=2691357 RepID=UPI001E52C6E6|nr:shikimate kinase [Stieleria sp. JC731]MCC9603881.1 shikimate kinase [Stieleria sp. JC731]